MGNHWNYHPNQDENDVHVVHLSLGDLTGVVGDKDGDNDNDNENDSDNDNDNDNDNDDDSDNDNNNDMVMMIMFTCRLATSLG